MNKGFGETAARTKSQGHTSWPIGLMDADFFITKEAAPDRCKGRKVFLMGHSMVSELSVLFDVVIDFLDSDPDYCRVQFTTLYIPPVCIQFSSVPYQLFMYTAENLQDVYSPVRRIPIRARC